MPQCFNEVFFISEDFSVFFISKKIPKLIDIGDFCLYE